MEDMERYGDYNDVDDYSASGKSPVMLILKIAVAAICLGVVGIIAFRMFLFNTYPENVSTLYFDDVLTDYYESTDGEIGAKTQKLRAPYDDNKLGNFFCDHVIVITGADQIQLTVRYNKSTIERINADEDLKVTLEDTEDLFSFRLVDNNGRVYDNVTLGNFESKVMYRYRKLVFNGVDLLADASGNEENYPRWIRLEIKIKGAEDKRTYMVPIYENNSDYNAFSAYELSDKERPQND